MQTDVVIIGGGISGLTAAWQLQRAGVNACLLEARPRFGGRILTAESEPGAECDLGPSWYWPGQPIVAGLLNHFGIRYFEQFADGAVLFQQMDGNVVKVADPSPMAGALRVEGGISRLTDAIANEIDPAHRLLNHVTTGLAIDNHGITVDGIGPVGKIKMQAQHVAVAIPPRLAAKLTFSPSLPAKTLQELTATPTWMAGHAKFFAVYDQPFWREQGLSGTAISRRGPLAEIHDASPNTGRKFCLFGFAGLDAEHRARMGRAEFIHQATAQLATLFGDVANRPTAVHFQDWSTEAFTASTADRQPLTHHPQYGLKLRHDGPWDSKLEFISTETFFHNGGLIEGALESGLRFAQQFQ